MLRLVVVILDHKISLPSILLNLVVWCNYFRWFLVVYLGWLIPYRKRKLQVVWVLVPATTVVGHSSHIFRLWFTMILMFTFHVSL